MDILSSAEYKENGA